MIDQRGRPIILTGAQRAEIVAEIGDFRRAVQVTAEFDFYPGTWEQYYETVFLPQARALGLMGPA